MNEGPESGRESGSAEPTGPAREDLGAAGGDLRPHDDSGLDLARAVARGLAGKTPAQVSRRAWTRRSGPNRAAGAPRVSGAHPDERDPASIDAVLGRLVSERGWETDLRVHGVFSRWTAIVGPEVGQHVTPEAYADGRLTVRADSTAWATQMKLLAADIVRRLNEVLGDGSVQVIDIQGPHLPRWTSGRFRVKGRGPRDTFG